MYKKLDKKSVIDFCKEHYSDENFTNSNNLQSKELSDGNINFVYRVFDTATEKSVIVKQATKMFRTSPEQYLTDERINFEIDFIKKANEICSGHAPEIYYFSDEMKCYIMEDCKNYEVMRAKMLEFAPFDGFGAEIARFLANVHFYTSDFCLNGAEKKALVKNYINPELCEITERLVFTEPFTNYLKRNDVPSELSNFVQNEIYSCTEVQKNAARLKYKFLTSAQALLHGDLHTGSIFINKNNFKVFDSEFSFVGPCSYDVGCIIGNIIFAYVAANVVGGKSEFVQKALYEINDILRVYKDVFLQLIRENTKDTLLVNTQFCESFLNEVLSDSVATAGVEVLRRTITGFKVKDITSLPLQEQNVKAQRYCILIGKELLINSEKYINNFDLQCVINN